MVFKILVGPPSDTPRARGRCPKCRTRWLLIQALTKGPRKVFECHACHSPIAVLSQRYVSFALALFVTWRAFNELGQYNPLAFYIAFVAGLAVYFDSFFFSFLELKQSFHEDETQS